MSKPAVMRNAAWAASQVVVSGVTLFLLYRFLIHEVGAAQLGVWALVLAATSVSRVSELGLGASVVKFVAAHRAQGNDALAAATVETALIASAVLMGCVIVAGYPLMRWGLGRIVPASELDIALRLLPYASVSLWLIVMNGVLQAGMDGCQRADLRSKVNVAGNLLYLFGGVLMVKDYGLIGMAYAQIAQAAAVLLATWMLLRVPLKPLARVPRRFDLGLARPMLGYGLNFHASSVAALVFDPITKVILTHFGGLSMVGYYEMASRLVAQFRSLLVAAVQVLIPVFADLHVRAPSQVVQFYRESYRLLFYLAIPLGGLLIASLPLISNVWIGQYEQVFVLTGTLATLASIASVLNVAAYFVNLGTGHLFWNTVAAIIATAINLVLGYGFGFVWAGLGVICAWALASLIGCGLNQFMFQRHYALPLADLLPRESGTLSAATAVGLAASVATYFYAGKLATPLFASSASLAMFAAIIWAPMWSHPMRARCAGWLLSKWARA